jgi:hypothetical protein
MAEKIRVVKDNILVKNFGFIDRSELKNNYIDTSDTFLFDLDQFYKDYRKEIAPLASCGTVILPSEYFKKWVENNKE